MKTTLKDAKVVMLAKVPLLFVALTMIGVLATLTPPTGSSTDGTTTVVDASSETAKAVGDVKDGVVEQAVDGAAADGVVELDDVEFVAWSRRRRGTVEFFFSRSETYNFAYRGRIPYLRNMSWGAKVSYVLQIGIWGHRAIAKSWYRRGYCVGFRLSLVPWRGNGMFGYRC